MIYKISESDYNAANAYLSESHSFGYEFNGMYLVNTDDFRLYDYDLNGMLEAVFSSTLSQYLGQQEIYEFPQETVSVKELSYKDSSNHSVIAIEKPSGNFDTIVSHNLCDGTTWSGSSTWELVPSEGMVTLVDKAEVQFEHDVSISGDTIFLEYHAWVAPGTTMVVKQFQFNSVRDLFELGNDHYHSPALPEIPHGLSTLVFNYASKLKFFGTEKLGQLYKLSVRTLNDTEITGSYATIGMVASEQPVEDFE